MDHQTAEALRAFTQRYCAVWQQQRHSLPRSEELYGVPSPCVVDTQGEAVFWQPQPFSLAQNISAVERALDIVVQQPLHSYYTTQFAGDMSGRFAGETLTLLQTWSEEDFQRVQENLIGEYVTAFTSTVNASTEKASVAVSFDMQYLEQKYTIQNEFKLRNVLR